MNQPQQAAPDLPTLIGLFFPSPAPLGRFEEVTGERMPASYRTLLDHNHHMTVTVEQFHDSLVNVRVLDTLADDRHYAREILLAKQSDGAVVQFGIVRLDFRHLNDSVRREVVGQGAPLGRILIQHNVLREIHLTSLWRVTPGEKLCQLFGIAPQQITYGRTAMIHCNGEPAIELLEIVAPVE